MPQGRTFANMVRTCAAAESVPLRFHLFPIGHGHGHGRFVRNNRVKPSGSARSRFRPCRAGMMMIEAISRPILISELSGPRPLGTPLDPVRLSATLEPPSRRGWRPVVSPQVAEMSPVDSAAIRTTPSVMR